MRNQLKQINEEDIINLSFYYSNRQHGYGTEESGRSENITDK